MPNGIDLLLADSEPPEAGEVNEPASALAYMQDVYKGRRQADPVRMRAAAIALPFESPKLTAMAVSSLSGEHFAAMLEKAIARSQAPLKQIELKANDRPLPEARPRGIHGRSGEGQR
jgi:hypothetical protein